MSRRNARSSPRTGFEMLQAAARDALCHEKKRSVAIRPTFTCDGFYLRWIQCRVQPVRVRCLRERGEQSLSSLCARKESHSFTLPMDSIAACLSLFELHQASFIEEIRSMASEVPRTRDEPLECTCFYSRLDRRQCLRGCRSHMCGTDRLLLSSLVKRSSRVDDKSEQSIVCSKDVAC